MNKINRILFIGNSITKVIPAPDIGWYGNWGMAASSEDKDYVHILMENVCKYNSEAIFKLKMAADFERNFWKYEMNDFNAAYFYPDMIIMRIGENVSDEEAGRRNFGSYYSYLINLVDPLKKAVVVCTNSFFENSNVNAQIEKVAEDNNYLFVDISKLHRDEKNMAKDKFWHKDVGLHPSDIGMENIANLIWGKVEGYFNKGSK